MMQSCDVILTGAGPAGVAAAVAAARGFRDDPGEGTVCGHTVAARDRGVLLVERYGFAGGMATAGMVNPFLGHHYTNPETCARGSLAGGVFQEVLDRLAKRKALKGSAFDETQLRLVYDEMLAEAGVEVLFHALVTGADVTDGHVDAVHVQTKSGRETIRAAQFIDATGDADLAAACGVPFKVGRPSDGLCQAMTTSFNMAGVDKESLFTDGFRAARERVTELFVAAKEAGRLDYPFKPWVQFFDYPRPGVLHFNMTHVWRKSGLDAWDLSQAEMEGRRQTRVITDWLVAEAPWFAEAYLDGIATTIGVRETRRIEGRYRMTREDVLEGRRFEDGIARSAYFIDIHDPTGVGSPHAQPDGLLTRVRHDYKPEDYYEIPFRCLQPVGVENLLVACRAISTTHEAHAATRVMATMHAVGEAAGRAAAMAKRQATPAALIDGADVRRELAYLDAPLTF